MTSVRFWWYGTVLYRLMVYGKVFFILNVDITVNEDKGMWVWLAGQNPETELY